MRFVVEDALAGKTGGFFFPAGVIVREMCRKMKLFVLRGGNFRGVLIADKDRVSYSSSKFRSVV